MGETQAAARASSVWPEASSLLHSAALGLPGGVLACLMFLTDSDLQAVSALILTKLVTFLLLSIALAFRLGWRQRNGIRGAVLGIVLGLTLILGFFFGLAVLPPLLSAQPIDALYLAPFYALLFVVVAGALGGAGGRAWQALLARSRQNNR